MKLGAWPASWGWRALLDFGVGMAALGRGCVETQKLHQHLSQ